MKAVVFAGARAVEVREVPGADANCIPVPGEPGDNLDGRLDDALALYQAFDQRADGVIKAVLHP